MASAASRWRLPPAAYRPPCGDGTRGLGAPAGLIRSRGWTPLRSSVSSPFRLECSALESRAHWFALLFAVSCALGSAYGFFKGLGRLGWLRRSGQPSPLVAGRARLT